MKIYISHSGKYDYEDKIYNPIKKSELIKTNKFFFPHEDTNKKIRTEDIVGECSLLIAEVSLPSTGQGIEMGMAYCAKVPILCIYEKGVKISSSLQFITDSFIEYENSEDMVRKISEYLKRFKETKL